MAVATVAVIETVPVEAAKEFNETVVADGAAISRPAEAAVAALIDVAALA